MCRNNLVRSVCSTCDWVYYPTNVVGVNIVAVTEAGEFVMILPPGEPRDAPAALPTRRGRSTRAALPWPGPQNDQRVALWANSSSRSMIPKARSGTSSTIRLRRMNASLASWSAGSGQYLVT